jgi:hypothetical protein
MSAARVSLSENAKTIAATINERYMLDDSLTSSPHNQRARVLRNGLAVCLFNMLEQFLKDRFSELIQGLSGAAIAYSDFPDELKGLVSIRAVNGLRGYLSVSDRTDRLALFHTHIGPVGGMNANPPTFSPLGFGYERSNIQEQDVARTLSAFGVDNSWQVMRDIAARSGIARPSLRDDFQLIGNLRNRAAHNPATNIGTSDLQMAANIVLAIAIGFDLVATAAVGTFCSLPTLSRIAQAVRRPSVQIRFIDHRGGDRWGEKSEVARRYIRTHSNLAAAKAMARSRTMAGRETVVVRTVSLIPMEWFG